MNDTKFKPIGLVHTKGSDAEVREKETWRENWRSILSSRKVFKGLTAILICLY